MQALRRAAFLARLVLAWFALSIGLAVAAPLVKPQAMELICTGTGAGKLLVKDADSGKPVAGHTLDCPMCMAMDAPPPVIAGANWDVPQLTERVRSIPAAPVAVRTASPLPARGPPASPIV